MDTRREEVELREITASLRRGYRWIVGGALLGVLLALVLLRVVTPRYEAEVSVLIQSETPGPQSALARLSGMLGGMGAGLGGSKLGTEIALLKSRTVLGAVVDSLLLQMMVEEPQATSPGEIFSGAELRPRIEDVTYRFQRDGDGYRVSGGAELEGRAVPGRRFVLPEGPVTLRAGTRLPERIVVRLSERQGAIERFERSLTVGAEQGDVVELRFRAPDPVTAAAVPNAMVGEYLLRRRTTDRGVNQHRYEFLSAHADTLGRQLAQAERALREHQERTGVLDPQLTGATDLERAMALQAELEGTEVESRALAEILRREDRSPRELAAYPSLLRSAAVTGLLSRLFELEADRAELLASQSERTQEVQAVNQTIASLDRELLRLATDYLEGLGRQRRELQRELQRYRASLGVLPAQAEESYRREREVKRLSETQVALQSQLVQARLDALSEGGEVRPVDPAVVPERPVFPNRMLTLFGAVTGGLFFGTVAAVVAGRRRRVRDAWEAEAATGLPSQIFDPRLPLSFRQLGSSRTLLVVPVGQLTSGKPVAEQIARTAALQGRDPVLADLRPEAAGEVGVRSPQPRTALVGAGSGTEPGSGGELTATRNGYACYPAGEPAPAASARSVLETLEERFSTVVAVLGPLDAPETVSVVDADRPAVLVARIGELRREELAGAAALGERLELRLLGLVLLSDRRDAGSS